METPPKHQISDDGNAMPESLRQEDHHEFEANLG